MPVGSSTPGTWLPEKGIDIVSSGNNGASSSKLLYALHTPVQMKDIVPLSRESIASSLLV